MDGDDPVAACVRLEPAHQIIPVRVVGGGCQLEQLSHPEARIAQDHGGVRPRGPGCGQLLELAQLDIIQPVTLLAGLGMGQVDKCGIVLEDDIPLHGVLIEHAHKHLDLCRGAGGQTASHRLVDAALPLVQGDEPHFAVRQGLQIAPGKAVDGGGAVADLEIVPLGPRRIDLGKRPVCGGLFGCRVGAAPVIQSGLSIGGFGVIGQIVLPDPATLIAGRDTDGPGLAAVSRQLNNAAGAICSFH